MARKPNTESKLNAAGNEALNDIRGEQEVGSEFISMMSTIDWKAVIIKGVIGYVFAMTAFIAANNVAVMIALLSSIVWLQYVIYFAVLAALAVGVISITPLVANTIYDSTAYVGNKIADGYNSARAWLSTNPLAAARQRVSEMGVNLSTKH